MLDILKMLRKSEESGYDLTSGSAKFGPLERTFSRFEHY
jgi:hypothetical protein